MFTKLSNLTSFWMLLQGLLKYILYTSRYPSIGFICFPTSGVKGVAALYEAFQVGGGGGGGGKSSSIVAIVQTIEEIENSKDFMDAMLHN